MGSRQLAVTSPLLTEENGKGGNCSKQTMTPRLVSLIEAVSWILGILRILYQACRELLRLGGGRVEVDGAEFGKQGMFNFQSGEDVGMPPA